MLMVLRSFVVLSGGGAVYHDLNNLNYTIISNKLDEGAFDFKTFSQPVIDNTC